MTIVSITEEQYLIMVNTVISATLSNPLNIGSGGINYERQRIIGEAFTDVGQGLMNIGVIVDPTK